MDGDDKDGDNKNVKNVKFSVLLHFRFEMNKPSNSYDDEQDNENQL